MARWNNINCGFQKGHSNFHKKHEPRFCNIAGCNKKHYAKGLCKKHYKEQHELNKKEHYAKYRKQYERTHKEIRARWRKDYNERYPNYKKQNYFNNKEYYAEYSKKYDKTPAGKAHRKADAHNRRTLTKDLTKEIVQRVYEDNIKKYGTLTCVLCNKPISFGKDSLEHLTPISRGGSNNYNNLGVSHLKCNMKKFTKTLEEWNTRYE